MTNRIRDAQPDRLSLLLSLTDMPDDKFADFSRICEEQLRLPVIAQSDDSGTSERMKLQQIACSITPAIQTFGDLLDRTNPPLELVTWAKDWAKASSQSLASYIPAEVGSILYYSYIAIGLISHNLIISDLDLADLKRGFEWCLKQTWPDDRIAGLIRDGHSLILLKIRLGNNGTPEC